MTATVLLVEDDVDVRQTTLEALSILGFDVRTASDGPAALAHLNEHTDVDVLFTDVVMPHGMTGIDLARAARAMYPGLRVLLASGYPRDALLAGHTGLGDFAFLSKPYRLHDLADQLSALIEGRAPVQPESDY